MIFLFFVLLALSGCSDSTKDEKKLAQSLCVRPQKYSEKSIFYGVVQASKSSPLVAQAEGILIWTKQPGDEVAKASIVARIDTPETEKVYKLALDAEAIASQQHKRSLSLAKGKITSQQQLQEKEHHWILSQQDLAKAESAQRKSLFMASFAGIMGPQLVHDGTHIKTGEIIGYVYNPSGTVVEVQIPATFKDSLKGNKLVSINNKNYTLPYVPKMLNPTTQMMIVHIPIEDSSLLIGEVIDVEIYLKEWENVVVVPLGSIKFKNDETTVLVLQKGALAERTVTLGTTSFNQAIITNGLEPGDIICLDPHHYYEGEKIIPSYAEL